MYARGLILIMGNVKTVAENKFGLTKKAFQKYATVTLV